MDQLRSMLVEHEQLIVKLALNPHLHSSLLSLRTTLLSCHLILQKALGVTFRRSAKFKQPIRISINDVVIGIAKLGNAISLAVAQQHHGQQNTSNSTSLSQLPVLTPGQEECAAGDKYFYGHGVTVDEQKALQCYSTAAEKGYAPAMTALGCMLREAKGSGKGKDIHLAMEWMKRAAALGNTDAMTYIGQMYEAGEGVSKNLEVAIEYYQQAANGHNKNNYAEEEQQREEVLTAFLFLYLSVFLSRCAEGHLDAQTNLGYIYEHGSEDDNNYVPVDLDAARAWYQEASDHGYAKAQNNLGYLYFIGVLNHGTPDYTQAIHWFTRAAEQGHGGAQNNLGICYETGVGVDADETRALHYYTESALHSNHASAQSSLGYLYLKQKQFSVALHWLQLAAEQNDKEAHYHLAQMYHHALYVEKNDTTAFKHYHQAATLQHPYAMLEVGHALFSGRGVKKDLDQAFVWYKQSALAAVSEAMNSIAIMYEEGVGVIQNYTEALQWYEKAVEKGNPDAMFNLALLLENGKGGQINAHKAKELIMQAAKGGSIHAKNRLEQEKQVRAMSNAAPS